MSVYGVQPLKVEEIPSVKQILEDPKDQQLPNNIGEVQFADKLRLQKIIQIFYSVLTRMENKISLRMTTNV